jgi:toxin ParE1/3/4
MPARPAVATAIATSTHCDVKVETACERYPPAATVTAEVVWTKLAREDLISLYIALGTKNPDAAERLYDRIERRAEQLAWQPRLGPRRPDIRTTLRVLVEAPHLILYETIPDSEDQPVEMVEIVRVLDGRRDLGALL